MIRTLTYRLTALLLALPVLAAGVLPAGEHVCEMYGESSHSGMPCKCSHMPERNPAPKGEPAPPCHTAPAPTEHAPDHEGDTCCTIEASSETPDAVAQRHSASQRLEFVVAWRPAVSELPLVRGIDASRDMVLFRDESPPDLPITNRALLL